MIERGLSSEEMLAESLRSKLYGLDMDSRYVTDAPEIREKPDGEGRLTLVMTREIQGFRMINAHTPERVESPAWAREW